MHPSNRCRNGKLQSFLSSLPDQCSNKKVSLCNVFVENYSGRLV